MTNTQTKDKEQGPRSVVSAKFKARYAEKAVTIRGLKAKGIAVAVMKDSSGDWLAVELAALIRPTKKKPADLDLFERICEANGVDLSTLPKSGSGWQGRFRMNGSQKLRTAVAEADGELVLPDGSKKKAPLSWVQRHLPK